MPSRVGWPPDAPCAKCGARVVGIGYGELCPACFTERSRRARRLSSRAALGATVLVGLYILWRVPGDIPLARIYGAIAVVATYLIVRRIVAIVAMEYLR